MTHEFWSRMTELVRRSEIVVDRPAGRAHPRYPDRVYPVDYGYLKGTRSGDGEGVDIWIGSIHPGDLSAVLCTLDELKGDVEVKLAWGCTEAELASILAFHNSGGQSAIVVSREGGAAG